MGDRAAKAHEQNMIDMDGAYADVIPLKEVVAYIRGLPSQERDTKYLKPVPVLASRTSQKSNRP